MALRTCGLPWGHLSKAGAHGQVQEHLSRLTDTPLYTRCGDMWPPMGGSGTRGQALGHVAWHEHTWVDMVRYGDIWSDVQTRGDKARCGDTC